MIVWNKHKPAVVDRRRSAGLSLIRRLLSSVPPGRALALGVAPCAESSDTARELAETCAAQAGLRVLLVQTRPSEENGARVGWRQFVRGSAAPAEAIRHTGVEGLHELPAGEACGEPSSRDELRAAVLALRDRYNVVLFDLAGEDFVGPGRDLAALLDGVLLVLPGPHPSREMARRAKRRLERAGAKVLGVVLDERGERQVEVGDASDSGVTRMESAARSASVLSLLGGRSESPSVMLPLSAAELRRAVALERIRADRTHLGFALLLWSAAEQAHDDESRWGQVIQGRLRVTDLHGRWDARRTAVLLPDTDEAGAAKLADDLRERLAQAGLRGRFEFYTHVPQSGADEDDAASPPGVNGNGATAHANGNGHASYGQVSHVAGDGDASLALTAAAPLESLLVRKLPWWKRLLDVCGAGLGIVLLSPLLILAGLAVKLSSRGPVFFRQARSGLGGRPFEMFKFRTMSVDAEARQAELRQASEQDGPAFKLKKDPRVTWVGKLLRKTSIDELPQLWNVLKGEMTLVGPRPLPCHETDACLPWQRRRLAVTPGLTCFWQVEGRSQMSFDDWMRSDLRYVRRRSPWTDFGLILRTIPAVLLGRGAH